MQNTPDSLVDVLVVGAGPVGLFFANELTQYGVSFRLIEKLAEPNLLSKALGITPRTMEVFGNRPLGKIFQERKTNVFKAAVGRSKGGKELFRIHLDKTDSVYNFMMSMPQNVTEETLHDSLKEINHGKERVEREKELIGYEQIKVEGEDLEIISAKVKNNKDGSEETIRARFIVGCDGVHSRVRKGYADWTYDGNTIMDEFALVECKVQNFTEMDLEEDGITAFMIHEGMVIFFPMEPATNMWRVIYPLTGYTVAATNTVTHGVIRETHPYTLEEVTEVISARLGKKIELSDALWVTKFHVNERKVHNFRKGSAFLAGDAAHCHSPVGGQGLNTGLQDAHNLAWKLYMVLNKLSQSPNDLLDSYSQEREPVARKLLEGTGGGAAVLMSQEWHYDFFRSTIMPWVLGFNTINGVLVRALSQKYIDYPKSSAILPSSNESIFGGGKLIHSGLVVPNGELDDGKTSFYTALFNMKEYRLALFANDIGTNNSAFQTLESLSNKYKRSLKPLIIVTKDKENVQSAFSNIPVYQDSDHSLHQKFGVQKDHLALVLIRPDMYIAAATGATPKDIKALEGFLGTSLTANDN